MAATPLIPSNPGWYTGYVPSALEWANVFSGKVDFPAPINQGGTGSQTVADANLKLQQRTILPGGVVSNISVLNCYGLDTVTAPVELQLPALTDVTPGDWIECVDIGYNAAANNIQVFSANGDLIFLWGVSATTQLINISGCRFVLVATETYWSMQW